MSEIKPIRTSSEHRKALASIDALISLRPKAKSVEFDRLETLTILVEAFERNQPEHRIDSRDAVDPVEAIKFALERSNKTEKDLALVLGCSRSRAWEILNYRRSLTLSHIRSLVRGLGIPPARLISEYETTPAGRQRRPARRATT